jgi:hypothetical protein
MTERTYQWRRDGNAFYLYANAPGQFSTCEAQVWRNARGRYVGAIKGGDPFEGKNPKALRLAINARLGLFQEGKPA